LLKSTSPLPLEITPPPPAPLPAPRARVLQLFLTLALTRVLSKLFSYLNQPVVIGEIVAGIIMGPSVLGHIPGEPPEGGGGGAWQAVFTEGQHTATV
jgi:hypothetical protein